MTAIFETGLFGSTAPGTFVKCLAFTLPPASTGTSHTISVSSPSAVTAQNLSGGMSWDQNTQTLTISSTFNASSARVRLVLSNGNDAFFSVFLSGSAQNGAASSLEVNAVGLMSVASVGTGVAFKGFTPLIQSIPENAGVRLKDALFLIPEVTGATDFSFLITNLTSEGSITISSTSSGISINSSSHTVTAQSSLAPGGTATVTVTYTQQSGSTTSTFTIQRISTSSPPSSGGQSSLDVAPIDGFFNARVIASEARLCGNDIQYFAPVCIRSSLLFSITTNNFNYLSQPVSFSNTTPSSTPVFGSSTPTISVVEITDTGTLHMQTDFTLATDAGTWDPTIINDPDDGPIWEKSESKETDG